MNKLIDRLQENALRILYVFIFINFLALVATSFKLTSNISSIFIFIFENLLFSLIGLIFLISMYGKKNLENYQNFYPASHHIFFKFSSIILFTIVILILLILKNTLYTKPLIYFILTSIAIVIIGTEICFIKLSNNYSNIILIQIIGIGSVIRFSDFILHPYVYSADAYAHYSNAMMLVKTGFLSIKFGYYYFYPLYTIFNGISAMLANLGATYFMLPVTIPIIISIIIVYLIGRSLFNDQIGLLSALFLIFGNFYFPSPSYQPTFFGIYFLLLAIYSVLNINSHNNKLWWVIFWLSALSVLLTHPVNTFVLLIFLGINFVLKAIKINEEMRMQSVPFLSYVIMYISYLIYVSCLLIAPIIRGIFIHEYVPALTTNIPKTETLNSIYVVELFINYLGSCSKLFLLAPAFLLIIRRYTSERLLISISLIVLYLIPLFEVIRGSFNLQSTRMLLYSDLIVVFILGFSFYEFMISINFKRSRLIFVLLCLSIMSFFSLSSYLFGDENEIFSKEIPIQPLFTTDSTIASCDYLLRIPSDSNVSIDYGTLSYISRGPPILHNLTYEQFDINSYKNSTYAIINYNTMPKGTLTKSGLRKFSPTLLNENFENVYGKSKIYSNGVISIFSSESHTVH
jgi:hypothetical protein